ncbi:MAG: low affinity iron permease family protein [Solirubrobacteraceae bacterium]
MTTKHPADRGGEGRGRFERVAERASNLASSPAFFAVCSALVLVWALSYALNLPDQVRTFLGALLNAVTLALVALIKNAERRAEHAIQVKLDANARALLETTDGAGAEELERAIGRHDEV